MISLSELLYLLQVESIHIYKFCHLVKHIEVMGLDIIEVLIFLYELSLS